MDHPILSIKNVTKRIKKRFVINNISFNIMPGEVVGLLGQNGAGKTTLMKMILGLTSISEGDIFINGTSIKTHREKCLIKMGGIIENPLFYPFLTGYENLKYYASLNGKRSVIQIENIIKLVKLDNVQHEKTKNYSLGMKQRLGIAQSLVHSPDLLILDEPMNGLDPNGIKEMRDYLKELSRKRKLAVLISSHLISEIELLCDHVMLLQNGNIINLNPTECNTNFVKITLSVNNAKRAIKILKEEYDYEFFITKDEEIKGELKLDEINNILELLIKRQIKIYELKKAKQSLEDQFIEVTGSDVIA